jgi:hypothetical protein
MHKPKRRYVRRKPRRNAPYAMSLAALRKAGGPERLAQRAAEQAVTEERKHWLELLLNIKATLDACNDPDDFDDRVYVEMQIKELRRRLGIATPIETVRAQTRERVRRFRERQRRT